MIPAFDDNGYLPPGVHAATLDEIEARFGQETEIRRAQMQSLNWLVDIARRAGIQKMIVNGSFVTDIAEPNDVDCALLFDPPIPKEQSALDELEQGLPFIQMYVVERDGYNHFIDNLFALDRSNEPKGMIEVTL